MNKLDKFDPTIYEYIGNNDEGERIFIQLDEESEHLLICRTKGTLEDIEKEESETRLFSISPFTIFDVLCENFNEENCDGISYKELKKD